MIKYFRPILRGFISYRATYQFQKGTQFTDEQNKIFDILNNKHNITEISQIINDMTIKTLILDDINPLRKTHLPFNLINDEKIKLSNVKISLTEIQLQQIYDHLKSDQTSGRIIQNISETTQWLLGQELTLPQYLLIIRNVSKYPSITDTLRNLVENQNSRLVNQIIDNHGIPIPYIIYFFMVMKNYQFTPNTNPFLVCQTLKYRLFLAKLKKMSLNHIFTLMSLDHKHRPNNFISQAEYKVSLLSLGQGLRQCIMSKISYSHTQPKDAKVLQSYDFYVNLIEVRYKKIYQFLKKSFVHDDTLYDNIEQEYMRNKYPSVQDRDSKITVILFNSLVSVNAGRHLFKHMIALKQKGTPSKFGENIYSIPFPQYIHSCVQLLLFILPDSFNSIRKKGENLRLQKSDLQKIITNLNTQKEALEMLDYFILHKTKNYENYKEQFALNPINEKSTFFLLRILEDICLYLGRPQEVTQILTDIRQELESFQGTMLQVPEQNEMNSELQQVLDELQIQYKSEFIVGGRIVDYYLPQLNLIIELDGSIHYSDQLQAPRPSQYLRNFYLFIKGYSVLEINYLQWEHHRVQQTLSTYVKQQLKQFQSDKELIYVQ